MNRMVVPRWDNTFVAQPSRVLPPMSVGSSFPLLTHGRLEQGIASRNGDVSTVREFLASAQGLASRLPATRYVINLCRDRYQFLIGFAAALIAQQISLLPNCCAPEALAQLTGRYPDAYVLADHNDVPPDMPLRRVPDRVPAADRKADIPVIPSEQVAVIVFTSGSSGVPRPHPKTWGSLVRGAQVLKQQFDIEANGSHVMVGTVPAQHMYGMETTIMLPLQSGWIIHAGHPVLPADVYEAVRKTGNSVWLMTTPIHLRAYVGQRTALPGLVGIISATMPLSRSLAAKAEDLWNVPVREIYGCTEGGMVGYRRPTATHTWSLCPGLQMWKEGDYAWVSGGHVGQSFQLADRIAMQSARQFTLHAPHYDLVKVAGKRTSLAALNAVLAQIEGVVDGTFYRPESSLNPSPRLTAFVVAPGLSASTIQAELRKRIDPLFLPRPLHLVEALPRNPIGKLPYEWLSAFAKEVISGHQQRES